MKRLMFLLCIFSSVLAISSCDGLTSTSLSSKDSLDIYNGIRSKQGSKNDSLPIKYILSFNSDKKAGGEPISLGKADTLITEFKGQFPGEGTAPMQTVINGQSFNLQGFFVHHDAFKHMFKNNNYGGFMIFYGKKPGMRNNTATIVLMPTEVDTNSKLPVKLHPELSWEEVDPCPNRCGENLPRDTRSYGAGGNFGKPQNQK